jgi:hypothetical protein
MVLIWFAAQKGQAICRNMHEAEVNFGSLQPLLDGRRRAVVWALAFWTRRVILGIAI